MQFCRAKIRCYICFLYSHCPESLIWGLEQDDLLLYKLFISSIKYEFRCHFSLVCRPVKSLHGSRQLFGVSATTNIYVCVTCTLRKVDFIMYNLHNPLFVCRKGQSFFFLFKKTLWLCFILIKIESKCCSASLGECKVFLYLYFPGKVLRSILES